MQRPGPLFTAVLAFALAGAARAGEPVTPDQVSGPETWGGVSNVTRLGHLSFAGQPDRAALEAAKAKGVVAVVNLRHPSELEGLGMDEREVVESLGMTYHSTPISGPELFDDASVAAVEAAVAAHEGEHVLVHCGSSNRVGGWLALHLLRQHGMELEDALAVGRRAGARPTVEPAVRAAARGGP